MVLTARPARREGSAELGPKELPLNAIGTVMTSRQQEAPEGPAPMLHEVWTAATPRHRVT